MSTTSVTAELSQTRSRTHWRPRLVSAEFLKLRKRRGLVISALALSVLPMIVAYTVLLSIHAANPAKHGPAGGLENLSGSMDMLSVLGVVAAILVGATLGAGTSAPASFANWSSRDVRASLCSRRAFPPASRSSCRSWVRASPSRQRAQRCSLGRSTRPAQASSSGQRPGSGS